MKYKITYIVKYDSKNPNKERHRYYNALSIETALDMFEASLEESIIGEEADVLRVYKNVAKKCKPYEWEEVKDGRYYFRKFMSKESSAKDEDKKEI